MKEIWRDVPDHELYQVSNLGKVRNKKTKKILKATIEKGYSKLWFVENKKKKTKYIHRLVASAFIPNPNNYREVNHKDNDPSNNCVENLEWCDRKYNIDYMLKHQEEIRNRHEKRLEILETIYYGIEIGNITNIEQIKNLIDKNLLDKY